MSATAGWHPDPSGRHELRWWDGTDWGTAVSDLGIRSEDPEGLGVALPDLPVAPFTPDEHAEVVAEAGVAQLPGDDPLTAPVLVVWRHRGGRMDPHPTWSVHDGVGRHLGTVTLEREGLNPNDRSFVLQRPSGVVLHLEPNRPEAVAVAHDGSERLAWVTSPDPGSQWLVAVVEGLEVAAVSYSVSEAEVTAPGGWPCGRMVAPSAKLRRRVGKRCEWDPVLVSEQIAVQDPLTARGVNVLALCWDNLLREWVA